MSEHSLAVIRGDLLKPAMLGEIKKALPRELKRNAERLIRVALTNLQRTPKLQECEGKSILACVMQSAQLGLDLDPVLGQAYMVPYATKSGTIAQLQIGYRGYEQLAMRSGKVTHFLAEVVRQNDAFDYQLGTDPKIIHKPAASSRGEIIGAYAIAFLKDGAKAFKWMSLEEIEAIRKRSKAMDSGPWKTDFAEMARKCPIRKLAKDLPLSPEFVKAAMVEEYAEVGALPGQFIEGQEVPPTPPPAASKADRMAGELKAKQEAAQAPTDGPQGEEEPPPPDDVPPEHEEMEPEAEAEDGAKVKRDASGKLVCPVCAGALWDNREGKKNPKAPDYKCKDKSCDGCYWPGQVKN